MKISPLNPVYAAEMAEIEALCFSLPWSEKTIRAELNNPIGAYWGAFENGHLVGYAGLQMILDEGYITNIATAPASRRNGIADALMQTMLDAARRRELNFLTLEVRQSNTAAQALYLKHGFLPEGIRRGYYEKPREDAVIMTLRFQAATEEGAL